MVAEVALNQHREVQTGMTNHPWEAASNFYWISQLRLHVYPCEPDPTCLSSILVM